MSKTMQGHPGSIQGHQGALCLDLFYSYHGATGALVPVIKIYTALFLFICSHVVWAKMKENSLSSKKKSSTSCEKRKQKTKQTEAKLEDE